MATTAAGVPARATPYAWYVLGILFLVYILNFVDRQIISILADKADIHSGPIGWIAGLDLNNVGYAIVGLFVLTWVVALAVWRFARIEERWTMPVVERAPADAS